MKEKAILFDIKHVAHVNFFKPLIFLLKEKNFKIIISYIDRGRLPEIIKAEFEGIPSYSIGKHRGTKYSIIVEANILKFYKALNLIRKKNIGLMLGVDAFVSGFACKILGIQNIQFYDDPERKINLWLEKKTSTELYYPNIKDFSGTSVSTYYALKEWAYLAPSYFQPKIESIEKYNLKPETYFFVREVDTGSLNYQGQSSSIIASLSDRFPNNIKVVLSLENKKNKDLYPKDWILLQEPVEDIHSIMFYSNAVISSGDSMAREGAMLGVPSYYIGFREMTANKFIEKEGNFFVISPDKLIAKLASIKTDYSSKVKYRETLSLKWVDVTQLMIDIIKKYIN